MTYCYFNTEYQVQNGIPVIHFWARDEQGTRHIFSKDNTRPYYYVSADEGGTPWDVPAIYGGKVGIRHFTIPREVREDRVRFEKTYEDDILFPLRDLIDRGIYAYFDIVDGRMVPVEASDYIPPRCMFFDTEIYTPMDMVPSPREAPWPVAVISCYDNFTKRLKSFTGEEKDIIGGFSKYVDETDPDYLVAWNAPFDVETMVNRGQRNNYPVQYLSPLRYVDGARIKARTVLDLNKVFKQFFMYQRSFDSTKLGVIAELDLNEPYEEVNYVELSTREELYPEFIKLCEKHTMWMVQLDEMHKLIRNFEEIRRFCGCYMGHSTTFAKALDVLMLRKFHGIAVAPSKRLMPKPKYKGAAVLTPPPGIHENVMNLDIRAMYPFIFMAYNISPEMLTDDPNDAHEIIAVIAGKKVPVYFKKKPMGIVPKTILDLINRREESRRRMQAETDPVKRKLLKQTTYFLKLIMVAWYGFFAYARNRWFKVQLSASITAKGREKLGQCTTKAEELGYRPLYGDTDSVFIATDKNVIESGLHLERVLNEMWADEARDQGLNVPIETKLETVFSKLLFGVKDTGEGIKKRYAGWIVWEDGDFVNPPEFKVRGFEPRRTSAAIASRRMQAEIIKIAFENPKDVLGALKNIDLTKFPLHEVCPPHAIRQGFDEYKNPKTIRDILWSNKYLKTNYKTGSKPLKIPLKYFPEGYYPFIKFQGKRYRAEEICFDKEHPLPPEFLPCIDWDVLRKKVIEKKAMPILSALGFSWSNVETGEAHIQQKLGRWV